MRQYQIIRESENGEREVWSTSTRKRDIESRFNHMMRHFKKEKGYIVMNVRIGYSIVEYFGDWCRFKTEWYITAVNA